MFESPESDTKVKEESVTATETEKKSETEKPKSEIEPWQMETLREASVETVCKIAPRD